MGGASENPPTRGQDFLIRSLKVLEATQVVAEWGEGVRAPGPTWPAVPSSRLLGVPNAIGRVCEARLILTAARCTKRNRSSVQR